MAMTAQDLRNIADKPKLSNTAQIINLEDIEKKIREYIRLKIRNHAENKDRSKEYWEEEIRQYIDKNIENWNIAQFVNSDNEVDKNELSKVVIDDILNRGILEPLLKDPEIDEIRLDGKNIIVVDRRNIPSFARDFKGDKLAFKSAQEQASNINKLIIDSKTGLNSEYKLVNGRTVEGYRVSATHYSAIGKPKFKDLEGYSDVTIRKFEDKDFTLGELVKAESLSDNMARLCKLLAPNISFVVVGEVFSGKTTFLKTLLNSIPNEKRMISIQYPVENDFRKYDEDHNLINDVLIWEAENEQTVKNVSHTNTIENLLNHTLRNSPSIVSINEIRENREFYNAFIIGQTGHCVNTSYHAGSEEEACSIFTNRLISITGQQYEVGLKDVTFFIKIIIHQGFVGLSERKVLGITEVIGHDGTRPILQPLYRYDLQEIKKNKKGNITEIIGAHKQVGTLSDNLTTLLYRKGVSKDELQFIQNMSKEETYIGKKL